MINNKYFTCGMKDRVGTDRDADSLTKLFTHLGFYTNRYDNLKGKDMREKLQVSAKRLSSMIQENCCYLDCGKSGSHQVRLLDSGCFDSWCEWEVIFN